MEHHPLGHQKFTRNSTRFYSQIFPVPVPFYPWRLGLHFQLILGDLIGGWQAVELAGRLQLALVDHLHALHQNDEGEPETLHTYMACIHIWFVYIYIYICVCVCKCNNCNRSNIPARAWRVNMVVQVFGSIWILCLAVFWGQRSEDFPKKKTRK